MRQAIALLGVAVVGAAALTGCDGAKVSAQTETARTMIPRPLVERELTGLLLSPDQVNSAMGATAMAVTHQQKDMSDNSASMAPAECLAIDGAAEAVVYAGSGFWAARDQSLNDGDAFTHYLKQAVVLFPTPEKAAAFVDASTRSWTACQDYTHVQSGTKWFAAQPTTAGGVLSTIATERDVAAPGWACGRALVARNNVVADVNTCSADPGDSAARIAGQIASNVAAQW